MKAQELSQKYANAIFSLALEKWLATLRAVQEKLAGDSNLADGLANADRTFAERQKELDNIIPNDSDQAARNFLYTLLKNGDIGLLGSVLTDLGQLSRGGALARVAHITTAMALSDDDKDKFRQKLRAQHGPGLEFVFDVDPAILGGAVVQIGDKIIDGSVQTRLEAMKNVLGVKS